MNSSSNTLPEKIKSCRIPQKSRKKFCMERLLMRVRAIHYHKNVKSLTHSDISSTSLIFLRLVESQKLDRNKKEINGKRRRKGSATVMMEESDHEEETSEPLNELKVNQNAGNGVKTTERLPYTRGGAVGRRNARGGGASRRGGSNPRNSRNAVVHANNNNNLNNGDDNNMSKENSDEEDDFNKPNEYAYQAQRETRARSKQKTRAPSRVELRTTRSRAAVTTTGKGNARNPRKIQKVKEDDGEDKNLYDKHLRDRGESKHGGKQSEAERKEMVIKNLEEDINTILNYLIEKHFNPHVHTIDNILNEKLAIIIDNYNKSEANGYDIFNSNLGKLFVSMDYLLDSIQFKNAALITPKIRMIKESINQMKEEVIKYCFDNFEFIKNLKLTMTQGKNEKGNKRKDEFGESKGGSTLTNNNNTSSSTAQNNNDMKFKAIIEIVDIPVNTVKEEEEGTENRDEEFKSVEGHPSKRSKPEAMSEEQGSPESVNPRRTRLMKHSHLFNSEEKADINGQATMNGTIDEATRQAMDEEMNIQPKIEIPQTPERIPPPRKNSSNPENTNSTNQSSSNSGSNQNSVSNKELRKKVCIKLAKIIESLGIEKTKSQTYSLAIEARVRKIHGDMGREYKEKISTLLKIIKKNLHSLEELLTGEVDYEYLKNLAEKHDGPGGCMEELNTRGEEGEAPQRPENTSHMHTPSSTKEGNSENEAVAGQADGV
eukprot:TRINITY_DN2936_c0_g1_i9.p1 TRINITY_DN2936_c0_g1~~TRINITY_DN2936_c0_g1_i9.p1  ORF type:complete len:714 (+),score=163.77 TRINITY_DN2936_c0_g1_i9:177-2318(+)